jgi:putative ABC transport system permease protein
MNPTIRKITYREIRRSLGRFLAIMGIIALGAGFLTGLRVTKTAMLKTLDDYVTENALYDYRVVSTLGLTEEDTARFTNLPGVAAAEGSVSLDVICTVGNGDSDVLRAMTAPSAVNTLKLSAGRMPKAANECVLDAWNFGEQAIGTKIILSSDNDGDTKDRFAYGEYTVVGLVSSPLYINFTRGTTSLGNGTGTGFFCIPPEGFNADTYTDIYVALEDTGYVYSDAYDSAVGALEDTLITSRRNGPICVWDIYRSRDGV